MPIDTRETYPAQFQEKLGKIGQLGGSVKYNSENYTRNADAFGKGSTAGGQALVEDLNSGGLGRASKLADIVEEMQKAHRRHGRVQPTLEPAYPAIPVQMPAGCCD